MKLKDASPWKKSNDKPRQHIKQQRCYFSNQGSSSQSYGFSSSHVCMWELDHKESWAPNNLCFWTVMLEKTLESPWTARRSNQSILKETNPEYSLNRLMMKLNLQYFDYLMWRTDSLERSWCLERLKARGEGDVRGWDGCEFEEAPGVGDGQGSLECCSPWGHSQTRLSDWSDIQWM